MKRNIQISSDNSRPRLRSTLITWQQIDELDSEILAYAGKEGLSLLDYVRTRPLPGKLDKESQYWLRQDEINQANAGYLKMEQVKVREWILEFDPNSEQLRRDWPDYASWQTVSVLRRAEQIPSVVEGFLEPSQVRAERFLEVCQSVERQGSKVLPGLLTLKGGDALSQIEGIERLTQEELECIEQCDFEGLSSTHLKFRGKMYKHSMAMCYQRMVGTSEQINYYAYLVSTGFPHVFEEDLYRLMPFTKPVRFPGMPCLHPGNSKGWELGVIWTGERKRPFSYWQMLADHPKADFIQSGDVEVLLSSKSPLTRPVADIFFRALSTPVFFKSTSKIIAQSAPKMVLYTDTVLVPTGVRPLVDFQSESLLSAYYFSRIPTGYFFRTRRGEARGRGLDQVSYHVIAVLDYAARHNLMLMIFLFDYYGLSVVNEWSKMVGNMCTDVIREKAWRDAAPQTVYSDLRLYRAEEKRAQYADVDSVSQSLSTLYQCLVWIGYPLDLVGKLYEVASWEFLHAKRFFLPRAIKSGGMKSLMIQTEEADVTIPLVPGTESDYELYPRKWFLKTKEIVRIAPVSLDPEKSKYLRVAYDSNRANVARFSVNGDCSFLVYDGRIPFVEVHIEYPIIRITEPSIPSPYS